MTQSQASPLLGWRRKVGFEDDLRWTDETLWRLRDASPRPLPIKTKPVTELRSRSPNRSSVSPPRRRRSLGPSAEPAAFSGHNTGQHIRGSSAPLVRRPRRKRRVDEVPSGGRARRLSRKRFIGQHSISAALSHVSILLEGQLPDRPPIYRPNTWPTSASKLRAMSVSDECWD